MKITATNNFVGLLDLSSLARLHEQNPVEGLTFHLQIKPNQIIYGIDNKWYTLWNIQQALIKHYITIDDYPYPVTKFTELTDAPNSYNGSAGKAVYVKGDESGLEFKDASIGELDGGFANSIYLITQYADGGGA